MRKIIRIITTIVAVAAFVIVAFGTIGAVRRRREEKYAQTEDENNELA